MGYVELANVRFALPGGRVLFQDLSFRVGDGRHVAIVGANGVGKTTALRMIAGEEGPDEGVVRVDGTLGYMRQFVGAFAPDATVRDLFLSLSGRYLREAWDELRAAERVVAGPHGARAQMRYANALAAWGESGGYDAEIYWDECCTAALEDSFVDMADRPVSTLSGGEQKRLALETLFRSELDVLLLDEPDNFLDIPGKQWLEETLSKSTKTVLFVSHDRAMLAATAEALVTLEGRTCWTHPGPFQTYADARRRRLEAIAEERRRFKEEHARIRAQIAEYKRRAAMSDKFASRARAMESKLERFEQERAPREDVKEQTIRMDLRGARTGKVALRVAGLSFPGLVLPFDAEVWYGDRVGVVGPNGSGKTHFLRLLAGEDVAHAGEFRLGARVQPALFSQLHDRPELAVDRSIASVLQERGLEIGQVKSILKRYGLEEVSDLPFALLSGGQQARLQIVTLELDGATMLLLDEPTDNLDIESAEALEDALARFAGTVIAVTHDRYFMQALDSFLVFDSDGSVAEMLESPYELPGGPVVGRDGYTSRDAHSSRP